MEVKIQRLHWLLGLILKKHLLPALPEKFLSHGCQSLRTVWTFCKNSINVAKEEEIKVYGNAPQLFFSTKNRTCNLASKPSSKHEAAYGPDLCCNHFKNQLLTQALEAAKAGLSSRNYRYLVSKIHSKRADDSHLNQKETCKRKSISKI